MTDDLYAKDRAFEFEATDEAATLLARIWPTIKTVAPTSQEVAAGLWETSRVRASDSPDPPGVAVGRRASSGGEAGATWFPGDGMIGYEWLNWDHHPRQRVRTLVHEALHVLGFVHPKGRLPAYNEVVQRVMRLPEIRVVRLDYERKLREPCGREGCAHPQMAHIHPLAGGDEAGELKVRCLRCSCSGFVQEGHAKPRVRVVASEKKGNRDIRARSPDKNT